MIYIQDYLKAGYPLIWLQEKDEAFALKNLADIAKSGKTKKSGSMGFNVWSCTEGLIILKDGRSDKIDKTTDPTIALKHVKDKINLPSINVFLNLEPYIEQPQIQQLLKDLIPIGKEKEVHIVIVSTDIKVPKTLEKDIAIIRYSLPNKDELRTILKNLIKDNGISKIYDESKLLDAASGLTLSEAENAFSLALVKHGGLPNESIQTVQQLKTQYIQNDGMLNYHQPNITMNDIAGLDELKKWLDSRAQALSEDARKFGLPLPKGILIAGVPGSGKSLTAKAVSAAWQLPLLQFDISQVFGSLVGESEKKMRAALDTAEAISPCILWIDEVEKSLSGVGGNNDSGVTSRVFGQFLTWMQEKKSMVFVIATANNIHSLPPEFLRKGRFDEFFWVDLPNDEERQAILELHIKKLKRDPSRFDTAALSMQMIGFSGAEIEEVVKSGLFSAFNARRELRMEDLTNSIENITPLSITMKEQIEQIRTWAKDRARNASSSQNKTVSLDKIKARSERTIHM